jgi:hypothetical protein
LLTKLAFFWLALIILQIALGIATIWTNKAADIATAHVHGRRAFARDRRALVPYCFCPSLADAHRMFKVTPQLAHSELLPRINNERIFRRNFERGTPPPKKAGRRFSPIWSRRG